MNNLDETIKRILLNMNYDSRKTLSENVTVLNKKVLTEQRPETICQQHNYNITCKKYSTVSEVTAKKYGSAPEYGPGSLYENGNMNRIWQFQSWVWQNVDGNELPPNQGYSDIKCTTILSNIPKAGRTLNCGNASDIDIDGAIDGIIGPDTLKAWVKFGKYYKKNNPNWNQDDVKTANETGGIVTPFLGSVEIKNFQKWFLEEYENNLMKGDKYDTELCKVNGVKYPCTYEQAVDGRWGEGASSAYVYKAKGKTLTAGEEYKGANKNWDLPIVWNKDIEDQKSEYITLIDKNKKLSALPTFFQDPSGFKGLGGLPSYDKRVYDLTSDLWWNEIAGASGYLGDGWNLNTKIFPYPKKYTIEDMKLVVPEELGYELKNNSVVKIDFDKLPVDVRYKAMARRSDALKQLGVDTSIQEEEPVGFVGFDQAANVGEWMSGIPTKYNPNADSKSDTRLYQAIGYPQELDRVNQAKQVVKQMIEFNTNLDNQKNWLPTYCSAPLAISKSFNTLPIKTVKYKSINKYYLCKNLGGLWVKQEDNTMKCGCRYGNSDSYLNVPQIGEITWGYDDDKTPLIASYSINLYTELGYDKESKKFKDMTGKEVAKFVTDITLPLTIAVIVFGAPFLSPMVLGGVLLALDIADVAAYTYLNDPYGAGLSLIAVAMGGIEFIPPNIFKEFIDESARGGYILGKKWEAFVDDFTDLLKNNTEGLLKKYSAQVEWLFKNYADIMRKMKSLSTDSKFVKATKTVFKTTAEATVNTVKVVSKVLEKLKNLLMDIIRKSPSDFIYTILSLLKSDNPALFNFAKTILINIPGPIYVWDFMAYKLGLCNTQHFKSQVNEYEKIVKMMEDSPDLLTDEQKKNLQDPTFKILINLAKGLQRFQAFTEPCQKIAAVESLLDPKNFDEYKKLIEGQDLTNVKKLPNDTISIYFKDTEIGYTPEQSDFDRGIYYIQSVLNDFLSKNVNKETVSSSQNTDDVLNYNINLDVDADLGKLTENTKKAIRTFRVHNLILKPDEKTYIDNFKNKSKTGLDVVSEIDDVDILKGYLQNKPLDSEISEEFINAIRKYVEGLPYQIDLLGGVGFDVSQDKTINDAIAIKIQLYLKKIAVINPPANPDVKVVEKTVSVLSGLSKEEKQKTIDKGLEKINEQDSDKLFEAFKKIESEKNKN
jgi:hypothetical protein